MRSPQEATAFEPVAMVARTSGVQERTPQRASSPSSGGGGASAAAARTQSVRPSLAEPSSLRMPKWRSMPMPGLFFSSKSSKR